MIFDLHIGIDYSGQKTPTSRLKALQVFAAYDDEEPHSFRTLAAEGAHWNWTREKIADWLIEQANSKTTFIAGIDHGFSFPLSYFQRYNLQSWQSFLDDFCQHWPTHERSVGDVRKGNPPRTGSKDEKDEFRLTDKWTSSAKSVFWFGKQGQVAMSTHAGIPWLRKIRQEVGNKVHFWPFDGWTVAKGRSVIAEVYPSLVRRRYPKDGRTEHQQEAYAVARWLTEFDKRKILDRYFDPPLTDEERKVANLEGWILGVS